MRHAGRSSVPNTDPQLREHAHWSYRSHGPEKWSTLAHDFGSCALGKTQSSIDIRDVEARQADLPAIDFDYRASPLKIIDNGHTIQVKYAPGSFISVGGRRYELVPFHFHKPSEKKVNGNIRRRFSGTGGSLWLGLSDERTAGAAGQRSSDSGEPLKSHC